MGLVDFTNPDATAWYQGKLRALIDQGVDCFKTDFGERIPLEVDYFDGSDPSRMHNLYTQLYNKAVHDVLVEAKGEGEAVLFARSATAGGQSMPVHWGGDSTSTFESMAETLRGGLSLGTQRVRALEPRHRRVRGNAGCRCLQALDRLRPARLAQPVPRLGLVPRAVGVRRGGGRGHPRLHPPEDAASCPTSTRPASRRQPAGTPIMRPMQLEFPDDPAVAYLDRQYMLGADILVAPVFTATGDVEFYLPAGTWTNLLTGEEVERWRVAARASRVHVAAALCAARRGHPVGCAQRPARLRLPRRTAAAGVRRRVRHDGGHRHDARRAVARRSRSTWRRSPGEPSRDARHPSRESHSQVAPDVLRDGRSLSG